MPLGPVLASAWSLWLAGRQQGTATISCDDGVRQEGVGVECSPSRFVEVALILPAQLSQLSLYWKVSPPSPGDPLKPQLLSLLSCALIAVLYCTAGSG